MTLAPELLDAYLARLGVERPPGPDLPSLRAIHAAHLRAIPFENSSVLFGEPIEIDPARFVRKLAVDGRGGFCYELNGAFAELLVSLGYEVAYLSARVYYAEGTLGRPFEHLALRVTLEGEPWLVDIGFGYSFSEPLRLLADLEQVDPMGVFRLLPAPADESDAPPSLDLEWRHRDGRFVPHFRVEVRPSDLAEFGPECRHLQTAPDSPFVGGWMCSRLVEGGGITLFGRQLVSSTASGREERELADDEISAILANAFSIQARREGDRWVRGSG